MSLNNNKPSLADELNARVDCEDLANRLGLERPGDRGNFRSPHHADKMPSLSVYRDKGTGRSKFKDFSQDITGGPVDLYMHVHNCDFRTAVKELGDLYRDISSAFERANPPAGQPRPEPRERTRAEWIADKCLEAARTQDGKEAVLNYLCGRGIAPTVVLHALERGLLGFNSWTSPTIAAGEVNHGGPAVAFIVRTAEGAIAAVDMRYIDPDLNGGMKTQSQGEKEGRPWCSDWRRFATARKVYLVESAINALSILTAMPEAVVLAIRGTGTVRNIDWRAFIGKTVVLCFDNDKPIEHGPKAGTCPGLVAAWAAHEALVALDVPALLVDQQDWKNDDEEPINDVNDFLQEHGADRLQAALKRLEPWLIPGMWGRDQPGKPRIWLPGHDFSIYWRFRVREDFTSYIGKYKKDEETGKEDYELQDVCGFRVAGLSRLTIASDAATMSGEIDNNPMTAFAVMVQVPRHPDKLMRRVLQDEHLHNLEVWKKLGPVYSAPQFLRLVNIMERAAHIGERDAINFVGVAWRKGKLTVNEGPDCYFANPKQQCPYSALTFPRGTVEDARQVITAYQGTFADNAAAQMLVWALGAHLKACLGFWPHFVMQADKGSGKSTLVKRLERSIAMTMFGGDKLASEYRIRTSISGTSHPVGWEEISARKQQIIDTAVAKLQECYQYTSTSATSDQTPFLLSAPVLLAGEDVPVDSIEGKIIRNRLTVAGRGAKMAEDLPRFPVRQWLDFLVDKVTKTSAVKLHAEAVTALNVSSAAEKGDAVAERMVENYAAVRVAWVLLCDFAGIDVSQGGFLASLTAQMNHHISDSKSARQPWVWIVDALLSEIARGTFKYPFIFDELDDEPVLCVRTGHVMDHISREMSLRNFFDSLPVKSDRVFKRALQTANVLASDSIERTVNHKRVGHMVALSLPALAQYGLHAVQPTASAMNGSTETN